MGMGAFFGGAAKGASQELDNQNDRAFKLKLQNAQIEGQMRANEQQAKLNEVDSSTAKGLREWSGLAPAEGPMNSQSAMAALGMGKANKMVEAKQLPRQRPTRIRTERVGNDVLSIRYDHDGNELSRVNLGINPASMRKVAEIDTEWAPSNVIIDKLDKSINKLLSDGNILSSYPTGIATKLSVLVQANQPEAIAITRASDAFALWLTAAVSGKQMTAREQAAMAKLLPVPTDTLDNAQTKLTLLSDMISSKREQAYKSYGMAEPKLPGEGGVKDFTREEKLEKAKAYQLKMNPTKKTETP